MTHTPRVGESLRPIRTLVYPQLPGCPQIEAWRMAMSFLVSQFGAQMSAEDTNREKICKERK